MQDEVLLKVTVITDDETGIYEVGQLDFGLPYKTHKYLETPKNREKLADWLKWLSDQCRVRCNGPNAL
jgi:hypothetical protein